MDFKSERWAGFLAGSTLGVFLTAAAFLLWTEHRAHLYGAIPYILLLLSGLALFFFLRSRKGATNNELQQEEANYATRKHKG